VDWICKTERDCEEERMNDVICLMLSTCPLLFWNNRTGISSFRAATTPRRRCATTAVLVRCECAGESNPP